MELTFFYLSFLLVTVSSFRSPFPSFRNVPTTGSAGSPLILTDYIKNGSLEEARSTSEVHHRDLPSTPPSHSGYFTVNDAFKSNIFFWYFPHEERTAPLILWLQGGPGASSLFGLFTENGPFVVKDKKMKRRVFSWTRTHSVIYIDNPVGTGFSFTDDGGYAKNQSVIADNLYDALIQFFTVFPEQKGNQFFVTGESYAGKYVPSLCYAIHKYNPSAKLKINLQGLAMGNGFSDPINQYQYGDYLYQLGLLDSSERESFKQIEEAGLEAIRNQQWTKAFKIFDELIGGDSSIATAFKNFTGFENYYNYIVGDEGNDTSLFYLGTFIQRTDVRRALHVGSTPFQAISTTVGEYLVDDVCQSVAPLVSELLSNYRVLIYNGQLDIIVAYPLTVNYLKNLNFSSADEYKTASRNKWYVKGHLAGYVKQAGNLTEVLVRNAGHMVPSDQPMWAFDLITRFTHGKSFY